MILAFDTTSVTAQTLATDESFINNVRMSIASAFMVEVENVDATIRVVRRLRTSSEGMQRRAASSSLQVDYEVKTTKQEEMTKMESQMQESSSRNKFARAFQVQLQGREASSGRKIVIDEVKAEEVKVAVTQERVPVKDSDASSIASIAKPSGDDSEPTIPPAEDNTYAAAPIIPEETTTTQSIRSRWEDASSGAVACIPPVLTPLLVVWVGLKLSFEWSDKM